MTIIIIVYVYTVQLHIQVTPMTHGLKPQFILRQRRTEPLVDAIIIIIINEFHRDASLKQNFRAAVCHVLH